MHKIRKQRSSLQTVRIPSPCPMRWPNLVGDDRTRFCANCNRKVHNLSAVTRNEAESILAQQENVCVAFVADRNGNVVTSDRPVSADLSRRQSLWLMVVAVASTLLSLVGSAHADQPDRSDRAPGQAGNPANADEQLMTLGEPMPLYPSDIHLPVPTPTASDQKWSRSKNESRRPN